MRRGVSPADVTISPWTNGRQRNNTWVVSEEIAASFGKRVRVLREKRGLSQEAFADLCRLDRTYISGIERGRRNPSLKAIRTMAGALGLSMKELFEGVG